jgi:hypothetical protein
MTMDKLIQALEKATEGSQILDVAIGREIYGYEPDDPMWHVLPFTTSIDAALTLVPEGHGWKIWLATDFVYGVTKGNAIVWKYYGPSQEVQANTPALALCIASLKARARQETPSHD